jgi:hypothetical protein
LPKRPPAFLSIVISPIVCTLYVPPLRALRFFALTSLGGPNFGHTSLRSENIAAQWIVIFVETGTFGR